MGLVELVVSMAVGSVLLLALGTTFTGTVRSSTSATASVTSAAELRPALDTMGRRLRVAVRPPPTEPALPAPTATSLSFYASLLPPGGTTALPPTLVAWSLGCPDPPSPVRVPGIAETRTTPSGSASAGWSWTTPASVRTTCLARGVVNADGAPLFRYYTTAAAGAVPLPTPVDPTAAVLSVGVDLALQVRPGAPTARAATRVTLSNLLPAT